MKDCLSKVDKDYTVARRLAEALNAADLRGARLYCDGDEVIRPEITIGGYVVRERGVWVVEDR